MLLTYISLSALIVKLIETDKDLEIRRGKVEELLVIYESVANETWELRLRSNLTRTEWNSVITQRLYNLSLLHEGELFPLNISEIETKWTFPSAVLYSTTIITTCGKKERTCHVANKLAKLILFKFEILLERSY